MIKAKFGVDAAKSTLCRWLNSVGLSYQRPVKRSIQQDETKVQEWLNTTYPALVKRAAAENA
ncbi:MAG: helix-turn-helix domain-containing protein, partial [Sutterella wadsworthensis]